VAGSITTGRVFLCLRETIATITTVATFTITITITPKGV
jgi:hypothetical protein